MSTAKTGGMAKLEWCKHIYWCDSYHEWRHEGKYGLTMPRDNWKFCPTCGKPRPKTGGIER